MQEIINPTNVLDRVEEVAQQILNLQSSFKRRDVKYQEYQEALVELDEFVTLVENYQVSLEDDYDRSSLSDHDSNLDPRARSSSLNSNEALNLGDILEEVEEIAQICLGEQPDEESSNFLDDDSYSNYSSLLSDSSYEEGLVDGLSFSEEERESSDLNDRVSATLENLKAYRAEQVEVNEISEADILAEQIFALAAILTAAGDPANSVITQGNVLGEQRENKKAISDQLGKAEFWEPWENWAEHRGSEGVDEPNNIVGATRFLAYYNKPEGCRDFRSCVFIFSILMEACLVSPFIRAALGDLNFDDCPELHPVVSKYIKGFFEIAEEGLRGSDLLKETFELKEEVKTYFQTLLRDSIQLFLKDENLDIKSKRSLLSALPFIKVASKLPLMGVGESNENVQRIQENCKALRRQLNDLLSDPITQDQQNFIFNLFTGLPNEYAQDPDSLDMAENSLEFIAQEIEKYKLLQKAQLTTASEEIGRIQLLVGLGLNPREAYFLKKLQEDLVNLTGADDDEINNFFKRSRSLPAIFKTISDLNSSESEDSGLELKHFYNLTKLRLKFVSFNLSKLLKVVTLENFSKQILYRQAMNDLAYIEAELENNLPKTKNEWLSIVDFINATEALCEDPKNNLQAYQLVASREMPGAGNWSEIIQGICASTTLLIVSGVLLAVGIVALGPILELGIAALVVTDILATILTGVGILAGLGGAVVSGKHAVENTNHSFFKYVQERAPENMRVAARTVVKGIEKEAGEEREEEIENRGENPSLY
jgi:hypothetical protein